MNINNMRSNINDKNAKKDYLYNSINNSGNNINKNINNNSIVVNNKIQITLNNITKDLQSFENNNIENTLNILNNIHKLATLFSKMISEHKDKKNNKENQNTNDIENINIINKQKILNHNPNNINIENDENKTEEKKDNIDMNNINNINNPSPQNNNDNSFSDILNNMNINEVLNTNPSKTALIDYILSVNESLKNQLKTLKMYIEIKKVFTSVIYQNIELLIYNVNQNQVLPQSSLSQLKNLDNQSNILSQIKDMNPQNNQINILYQITPPPQISLNSLNDVTSLNGVSHSTSSILNTLNLNNSSPIFLNSLSPILQNNDISRGLPLFNFPGQQYNKDFSNRIPNIFNGSTNFSLNPPQQHDANLPPNQINGQNIPQIIPILNQLNNNGISNINNEG
jgi:hypothetical protein